MTALEDRVNPVAVSIASQGDITEGGSDSAFTISRDNSSGSLTVNVSYSGTASQGFDYFAMFTSVLFSDGQSSQPLPISPWDDGSVEGTETIIASISSSMNYTISGTGSATMNLYDNDTTQVTVAKQGGDPIEGDSSAFRITRSGSTSGNLTVNFTHSGSATSGTDYTSMGTSATILNGNSYVDVTVDTDADLYYENNETVSILLTDGGGTYSAYGSSSIAAMIIDDDVAADAAIVSLHSSTVIYTGGAGVYSDLTVTTGSGTVTIADSGPSGFYIDAAFPGSFSIGSGSVTYTGSYSTVDIRGDDGDDLLDGTGFTTGSLILNDGSQDDTLLGSAGDDSILGGSGNDDMDGGDGDDIMHGGTGDNILVGGDGGDFMMGDLGDGSSTLLGGDGDDTLCSDPASDIADGEAGDDLVNPAFVTFIEEEDAVYYYGGAGIANKITVTASGSYLEIDDTEWNTLVVDPDWGSVFAVSGSTISYGGGYESVQIAAGDMDDTVDALAFVSSGNLTVWGGGGKDEITGSPGRDYIYGEDDADEIMGMGGDDMIEGGKDNDVIYGDGVVACIDDGADDIWGEGGDDFIYGGGERDRMYGGDDFDNINGNGGDDIIDGGVGNDNLIGEAGNDMISGDDDVDTLVGGEGDDVLDGGNHNDTLQGGTGDDYLEGGNGEDLLQESDTSVAPGGDGDYDTLDGSDGVDTVCVENGFFDAYVYDLFDVVVSL